MMEVYTLMLLGDERSPVRNFRIRKRTVRSGIIGLTGFVLLLSLLTLDYVRVRINNAELGDLRVETAEQRTQMGIVEKTLRDVRGELERVNELERKVRIIANLPGAAGVGGEDVTEITPVVAEGDRAGETEILPPMGVPVDLGERPQSSLEIVPSESPVGVGLRSAGARRLRDLDGVGRKLGAAAGGRVESLESLITQLEDKRHRLASMPSIWPVRGWLTSRFGARISPFTGRRHHHGGIDISTAEGTPIHAPARGRVASTGDRGPLGKSFTIDHGHGVKTLYGHSDEIFVKTGDRVERGQLLASVGNTGRSTGPHLHYVVQVGGKSRDPLDYIFD
jgi:hypothetical protein